MNSTAIALIFKYCLLFNVPSNVAIAIAKVESGLNQQAVGMHGEIGMFQILPSNYPNVNLKHLETNIKYGVFHLSRAKEKCNHQVDYTYVLCYNLGMKGAEKVKHPKKFPYYRKVMKHAI